MRKSKISYSTSNAAYCLDNEKVIAAVMRALNVKIEVGVRQLCRMLFILIESAEFNDRSRSEFAGYPDKILRVFFQR